MSILKNLSPKIMIATLGGYQEFSQEDFEIVANQFSLGNKDAIQEYIKLQDIIFLAATFEKEKKIYGKKNLGFYDQFIKPDFVEFFQKVWVKKETWGANYLSNGADQEDIEMLNNLFKYLTTK